VSGGGAWVFCGAAHVPVPAATAWAPPAPLPCLADPQDAVAAALAHPLGARRLQELAAGTEGAVAIAIPDASRSCPSPLVLRHLLMELERAGVSSERIRVVIGCGLHAPTDETAKRRLVGDEVLRRVAVLDGHGLASPTVDLGRTSLGAPVRIVTAVAEAALTICVGIVEPHLYAGFSGGVKGVAIGCAGHETIAWTHHPAFISRPGVALAQLANNPFQQTLTEIAARTSLSWAVNLVVDERGRPAAVAAGDPALVQSALAATHASAWLHETAEQYDVIVAGVPAPKSDNLYQASRAATYVGLAARPALAPGGLLVLCADLPDEGGAGPGERNFLATLAGARSAAELVARGRREPLGPGGQRSFVLARVLERFRLAPVRARTPSFLAPLAHLGVTAFDSVAAAIAAEQQRLGRRVRVLAVADALTTLVSRGSPYAPDGHTHDRTSAEVEK
jgi:nickel-dependent lactate racemase